MTDALLKNVAEIAPVLRDAGARADAERMLPDVAYDAMLDAGLFGMTAPKAFDGQELHPVETLRVIEAVAKLDSAAGWNLNQASAVAGIVPWLSAEGADEVYARGPATIFAGGFFPQGPSVRVDGGWRVTARQSFVSGCQRAQWFGVPLVEVAEEASVFDPKRENPPAIVAFIPRDEVDIIDTWHTVGMRGTFSADVVVDDVFVPDHRVAFVDPNKARPKRFSGPLYGLWPWVPVHGEASVCIGIAGAAVDALIHLATRKHPAYARAPLHSRAMAQHHIAKAQALVDASRATLHGSISEAYGEVSSGAIRCGEAANIRCQLAACFATEACAEAVDLIHEMAGGSAIRVEHDFEQHHRDIHVLTQHAYRSTERYVDVGKLLVGLPPEFWILEI
jgi:alkylation response protein AidB-like acyl-CoA dehydrogenase